MISPNEQQVLLRQTARQVAQEKVLPRAGEIDRSNEYPWDLVELFAKYGFLGLKVPEEYGGNPGTAVDLCIVLEEISKASYACAAPVQGQAIGGIVLSDWGSDEQRRRYLPEVASGARMVALAITEPEVGSDATKVRTRASKTGDHYVVNGTKCFISSGSIAGAYVLFASTDPSKRAAGLSTFFIERNTPGLKIGKIDEKMGSHGIPTAELIFEDAVVPEECLLGKEGDGLNIIVKSLGKSRVLTAARAVGLAQGALDYALQYALQRVQSGGPIAHLQGIQFMLADMATAAEAARCLTYEAAHLGDIGSPEASRVSSMAKYFAADAAMQVTTDAVQVLGGHGYMKDHPVERMMRDAKATQVVEGTNQIQRRLVARSLIDEAKRRNS
ncbi:MAG: acyl-CoA dehydrogenase family protein [Chloroflexi bacterium]|nr:acyl-CoA dehydrogenase family protein [Chloroflexota bacterium]